MAMAAVRLLVLLLLLCGTASASGVQSLLKNFGIPKGVLPKSKNHSLSKDGLLSVQLKAPCYVRFFDVVYYQETITGKISYGAIYNLTGVQVSKYFEWFPVSAIRAPRDTDTVVFDLASASLSYSADEFGSTPNCLKGGVTLRGAAGLFARELLPAFEA